TRIWVENESGWGASFGVIARSQRPLRLIHSLRASCGLGYSGWTFFGVTSALQRVLSGPVAGSHALAPLPGQQTKAAARNEDSSLVIDFQPSIPGSRRRIPAAARPQSAGPWFQLI